MRRGRPRLPIRPIVFSIKLVLHSGRDDDLIEYLKSAGPRLRATLVKLGLRGSPLVQPSGEATREDDLSLDSLLQ